MAQALQALSPSRELLSIIEAAKFRLPGARGRGEVFVLPATVGAPGVYLISRGIEVAAEDVPRLIEALRQQTDTSRSLWAEIPNVPFAQAELLAQAVHYRKMADEAEDKAHLLAATPAADSAQNGVEVQ